MSEQMTPPTPTQATTRSIEAAASLGALASLGGVLGSIVYSKVAASYLGPIGIGMGAQIQQLATLALVPLTAFAGPALYQALARERASPLPPTAVTSAATWVLALGSILGGAVTLLCRFLLPQEWSAGSEHLVALASVGIIASGLLGVATSALTFEGRLTFTAQLQIAGAAIGAAVGTALTVAFGLTGQFAAVAITQVALVFWAFRGARASRVWLGSALRPSFDTSFLRGALQFGAASLIAAGALQAALWAIRWRLELSGGPELNGQFQASWTIGSVYLGMILTGVGSFAFPRYASAPDQAALQEEVDNTSRFVIRLAPPLVLLAIGFADVGVRLFYSNRFEGAIEILRWQLAGDVARCLSWAYAGPLIYRGRVRAFLLTELVGAGILAGSTWILVGRNGASGAGQASLLTYAIYLPLTATVTFLTLTIRPRLHHLAIAIVSTLLLTMIARVESNWLVRAATLTGATLWLWRVGVLRDTVAKGRKLFSRVPRSRNVDR